MQYRVQEKRGMGSQELIPRSSVVLLQGGLLRPLREHPVGMGRRRPFLLRFRLVRYLLRILLPPNGKGGGTHLAPRGAISLRTTTSSVLEHPLK